jgi:hypothetical protein
VLLGAVAVETGPSGREAMALFWELVVVEVRIYSAAVIVR